MMARNQGDVFIIHNRVVLVFDLNCGMMNTMLLAIPLNIAQQKMDVSGCYDVSTEHNNTRLQGPHMQIMNGRDTCKLQMTDIKTQLLQQLP